MRPVICMIIDRMRFGPDGENRLAARVAAAANAGVHLVQVREHDLDGGPLLRLVRRCLEAVRATDTRVIVNERLDVALAAGAHGVHLRATSMAGSRARALVPNGFLIGRSVHSREDVERANVEGTLDYIIFGSVFATSSKPGRPPAGVDALVSAVQASRLPLVAVGGVTAQNAATVGRTGASGFAAIGLFADTEDESLAAAVSAARSAFDSATSVP